MLLFIPAMIATPYSPQFLKVLYSTTLLVMQGEPPVLEALSSTSPSPVNSLKVLPAITTLLIPPSASIAMFHSGPHTGGYEFEPSKSRPTTVTLEAWILTA